MKVIVNLGGSSVHLNPPKLFTSFTKFTEVSVQISMFLIYVQI